MVTQKLQKYGTDICHIDKNIDDEKMSKEINLIISSYCLENNGLDEQHSYGFISLHDEDGKVLKTKDGYKISFSVNVPELINRLSKFLIKNENDFTENTFD